MPPTFQRIRQGALVKRNHYLIGGAVVIFVGIIAYQWWKNKKSPLAGVFAQIHKLTSSDATATSGTDQYGEALQ